MGNFEEYRTLVPPVVREELAAITEHDDFDPSSRDHLKALRVLMYQHYIRGNIPDNMFKNTMTFIREALADIAFEEDAKHREKYEPYRPQIGGLREAARQASKQARTWTLPAPPVEIPMAEMPAKVKKGTDDT